MLDNKFKAAPDWTIEIVSPEQSSNILIEKITFCVNNGSQLGWLIDPEDECLITFQPNKQPEVRYNSEPLPVLNILPDLQLSAKEIFSWLYM
jgi:Uma2 family endonuclease